MPPIKYNPITPGQRFKIGNDFSVLSSRNSSPEKSLSKGKSKSGGRNNQGRMTMRYIGGGHKRKHRLIDFKRTDKIDIPAVVKSIEYDPNRSSFISLLYYADGEKRYILSVKGLKVGQKVISGEKVDIEPGNAMQVSKVPLGTFVSSIELIPGKGAALARSAGSYAQIMARDGKYVTLKLPSGQVRMILGTCMVTIGVVSNSEHQLQKSGKAGRSRWLGRRPRTRGVAMNPVDHPMGGGEGKASGGQARSRNGVKSKGFKTRSKKKLSSKYILIDRNRK